MEFLYEALLMRQFLLQLLRLAKLLKPLEIACILSLCVLKLLDFYWEDGPTKNLQNCKVVGKGYMVPKRLCRKLMSISSAPLYFYWLICVDL